MGKKQNKRENKRDAVNEKCKQNNVNNVCISNKIIFNFCIILYWAHYIDCMII